MMEVQQRGKGWVTVSRTIGIFDRFKVTEYFSEEGFPSWFGVTDICSEYDYQDVDSFEQAMAYIRGDKINPVDGWL